MQTPPRLLLDGWSDRIKLYLKISKLPSSYVMLESRYVSEIQTVSNFDIIVSRYAISDNSVICTNSILIHGLLFFPNREICAVVVSMALEEGVEIFSETSFAKRVHLKASKNFHLLKFVIFNHPFPITY